MSLDIMIVDDAGFIRELISSVVVKAGHRVCAEAAEADEALMLATRHFPDLIFLDLVLPGMNGIELMKQLKALLPTVKIAACSSITEEHFQKKAFEAGCFIYINKPFTQQDLLQVIKLATKTSREVING